MPIFKQQNQKHQTFQNCTVITFNFYNELCKVMDFQLKTMLMETYIEFGDLFTKHLREFVKLFFCFRVEPVYDTERWWFFFFKA